MQVSITLGGALAQYLPGGIQGNTLPHDCSEGATLATVLSDLGIPSDKPMLIIVNGELVPAENYAEALLADGDTLSVVPPIQAG
ncbi:MAG: MoaD/ThiS family protein [Granulosicoccus sp.]|nr:MoaD/ThiS family protein [Granulosicoccus sp.]